VLGGSLKIGILACAISLPLVLEGILAVIPIHGPIIAPLRPVFDGLLDFLRDIIGGVTKSVRASSSSRFPWFRSCRRRLEEIDITLLHDHAYPSRTRHTQGNAAVDIGHSSLLLGDLVQLESKVPAKPSTLLDVGAFSPVPVMRFSSLTIAVTSPT
jgi:hypothetical protein